MLSVPVGAFAGAILSIVLVYSLARTAGEVAPIRLVLVTARLLGRVPFGALYPWGVFHALALAGIYVLLIFYALFHKGKLRYYVAASACVAAAWVFLGGWLPRQEDFRLAVLDVGQGQSLVLSSRGQTLVIDCGGRTGQSAADRTAETGEA